MNNYEDPTGLAALIVGALTPVVALLGILLHWEADLSGAWTAAITGAAQGIVGVIAIWNARRHAYAPKTVDEVIEFNRAQV